LKVYLAARYSLKDEIAQKVQELRDLGIEVTSRWLEEPHAPSTSMDELSGDLLEMYADTDVHDIKRAHMLVFFSQDPKTPGVRGGRHVEFGIAHALGKTIVVVGPRENIFHFRDNVAQFDTWEFAKQYLISQSNLGRWGTVWEGL